MTTADIIMILIGIIGVLLSLGSLIVAVLEFLDKRNNRQKSDTPMQASGYLTLAAFVECSCKHGILLIARGNKNAYPVCGTG